ncbi:MAG: hypothetical protein AAB482_01395 [Patescibacteria group bacterium]
MKNIALIVVVAVIGIAVGYFIGSSNGMNDKKLEDSIAMMKEQSMSIQKMAEMIKSSGMVMQGMGMKYKDDTVVAQGKDFEAFGDKYSKENAKAIEKDASMKQIMK